MAEGGKEASKYDRQDTEDVTDLPLCVPVSLGYRTVCSNKSASFHLLLSCYRSRHSTNIFSVPFACHVLKSPVSQVVATGSVASVLRSA